MAKRRSSVSFKIDNEDAPKKERDPNRQRHEDVDSGLDFEDPFEDEYEEESYEDGGGDDENEEGDGEEENDDGAEIEVEEEQEVWLPNLNVEKDVKLEFDETAYDMLHFVGTGWPCLSFEILPDSLGAKRSNFPHTVYVAAGTQAEKQKDNRIILMKCSSLGKCKPETDSSASFDLDNDSEEGYDIDPICETREVKHEDGCCNRLRVMPQHPHILAGMFDSACVQVYDLKAHLAALDAPPDKKLFKPRPVFTFKGHPCEGYGMAWNTYVPGRLITSDCARNVFWWEAVEGGWNVDMTPFNEHTDSVEDLQWSPSEGDVFASCSVDRTIKLWDARRGKGAVATLAYHNSDVNVIAWNPKRAFFLASGGDDGVLNVMDLRTMKDVDAKPLYSFDWHKAPITSLEWHPHDDAGLAASSDDNSISLWDLSLSPEKTTLKGVEIPSQLMFIHQGQNEIKEVHWHKQIPGCLVSTANEGLNIFKPFNH